MESLTLNLKKEYFEQIKSGIKTEEYRLCTPYWRKRLEGKNYDNIILKLGYPKKKIKHKHFGVEEVEVYALKLISNDKCIKCGCLLTTEEKKYYEIRCENCESKIKYY